MEALTSREQELEYCLRELWGMIERNELVRNTIADGMPDWYARMTYCPRCNVERMAAPAASKPEAGHE